ncbi:glycosyltransferase family 87 protein [Legionella waltersii]|uniref:DUF2029 domain-containing protein n=1 Tax=Legionella waltersii TaxID=66969 RepID=A0A0W1A1J7_9GAMM|nr:glycosyltransferase family 87 protein [Legionella waltersii]KTD75176.1 hypothetical protein Lwal_3217 [Legionella waltersii]SNV04651.1 Protein of uncharacterised function (DUF2029) [Legionella waltersii]
MRKNAFLSIATIWLLILYIAIFYYQINLQILIDYSSFYAASKALADGITPYQVLTTTLLEGAKKLPTNLNPPCVLWLLQPITYLPFKLGLAIWDTLSVLAGIHAARLTYRYFAKELFPSQFQFWLLYFALFPIIMNFTIAQVGSFIAFFVLQGYHHLRNASPIKAGFYWGCISAMKLFPLLLLIYAFLLKERRACLSLIITFIGLSFIPLIQTDISTYFNYALLVKKVFWYGDNWNASLYGYLFRLWIDCKNNKQDIAWIEITYLCLLVISCIGYIYFYLTNKHIKADPANGFNYTVTTMLFLSPLGWLYYFQLLLPQALLMYQDLNTKLQNVRRLLIKTASLTLLLFPTIYIPAAYIPNIMASMTFFSFYFYGLLFMQIQYLLSPEQEKVTVDNSLFAVNRLIHAFLFLGTCVPYYYLIKMIVQA